MDFKQLETFIIIAKYKSFSKAAKELFLTQPTISNHIQNLEKELGTILINRNNKNISLTKAGEILYTHALEILNSRKKALYNLKEYEGKIEGIIEFASSSIPEAYILPKVIKSFNNEFPDAKFTISHYDSQDAIEEILDEKIHFGFVGTKIPNSQIEYIELIKDELVLITPYDYKIPSSNGYVSIESIKNENLIMRKEGSGTRKVIVNSLKKNNLSLNDFNIIAHVESNEATKEMVRAGLGLSIVSNKSVIDSVSFNALNSYKIKELNLNRSFYFIYSKKRIPTPLEEKFINHILYFFK
ncbi:selenium metabolism-associated LysR family transcriptional regulator [Tepidibacter formicigenes]|jgi:DNA-binding transcriptional LysR family regulator|uniref:DNA-binding transcriptional regulator, LysR family n=1 Tax=Tepidibacter formicigenes DSM 15518 TaxID=1123349 RepID=A0A1M6K5S0_9FIRM|nr:selenium metabolism-associated LysR family transcriptional regulator [Tepidibacter formicigenes]SHJ54190.1 DNA-binding transcriptional regulator, LysR family [Tepidibacter formicigenes DSM 15518]